MTELVPAEAWHIEAIAANARQADLDELWAGSRCTPAECLERGLAVSVDPRTALIDGVPVCMFGATPYSILAGIGIPWMVGTTGLDSFTAQKDLLRLARPVVADMRQRFPALLFNFVDQRNTSAQRWLHWLGFTLLDPEPVGPDKALFRPFFWRGTNV